MSGYVGVDWGGNGWVCAVREESAWHAELHPSFLSVRHNLGNSELLLVDIPIGLRERGLRECDREAKEMLGGERGRSVFLTPPRPAFGAATYGDAKASTEARTDRSLTVQAWNIMPRIRELDEFLATVPGAHGTVREAHPEVCFAQLGDGPVIPAKDTPEGRDRRLSILADHDAGARAAYERLVDDHIESQPVHARRFRAGSDDDLVDAMCLAMSGWVAGADGLATLPADPPVDDVREVPREIVYPG